MKRRYHVRPDGSYGICTAGINGSGRTCRYGEKDSKGRQVHYSSKEEAQRASEKFLQEDHSVVSTIKKITGIGTGNNCEDLIFSSLGEKIELSHGDKETLVQEKEYLLKTLTEKSEKMEQLRNGRNCIKPDNETVAEFDRNKSTIMSHIEIIDGILQK